MKKLGIMIVEDDAIVAHSTKMVVEEIGHEVTRIAASGEDAISSIGEERPDLVIMDLNLSGKMLGFSIAEKIISQFDIPVIMLTAYSDTKLMEQAKQMGCCGYLVKPVDPDGLRSILDQYIAKE